jgi:hypothetical protein
VNGSCALPHLLGEPCEDWEGSLPDRCEAGTTCSRSPVDAETVTCQPLSKTGEICDFGRRYDDDNFCEREPGYDLLCLAKPDPAHYPYCGDYSGPCRVGLYCSLDDGCLASSGLDEPCITTAQCSVVGGVSDGGCSPCALGLICVDGTCRARATYGEHCGGPPCAAGLACLQGQTNGECADSP